METFGLESLLPFPTSLFLFFRFIGFLKYNICKNWQNSILSCHMLEDYINIEPGCCFDCDVTFKLIVYYQLVQLSSFPLYPHF